MKKIFSFGAIAAAAMAFVGCAQEIEQPKVDEGAAFELVASVATKTVNDGMSTKWVSGDALNVFYAEAGSTAYSSNRQFTVSDVDAGLFTGTVASLPEADKAYDWYALYPYSSYIKSPNNTSEGYTYIGHTGGVIQAEYGSKDGLDGTNCPMYAVVKNNPGNQPVVLEMQHLTSVIELKVTNGGDDALTINTAYINIPGQDVVGSYFINYAGDEVVYTPRGSSSVKEYAQVKVTNPTALAKGETAALYFIVKPFVLAQGDSWSIAINDQSSAVEKMAPAEIAFVAGDIRTVNYTYVPVPAEEPEEPGDPDTPAEPEEPGIPQVTVSEFLAKEVSDSDWYQLTGAISNIENTTYGNFYLTDETGTVYVYGLTATQVATNDKSFSSLGLRNGDVVTLIGTRAYYEPKDLHQVGGPAYYVSHVSTPYLEVANSAITVNNDVTEAVVSVDSNIEWTVSVDGDATVSVASGSNAGTVTISFAANEGADAVTYTVTLSGDDVEDVVVTITQKGVPAADYVPGYYKVTSASEITAGTYLVVYEKSATQGYVFNGTDAEGNYATVSIADSFIDASVSASTVEITASGSGYAVKVSSGYISGKSGKNSIQTTSTAVANDITFEADGKASIYSDATYLVFNSATSNGNRFRYYKETTVSGNPSTYVKPYLYKLK